MQSCVRSGNEPAPAFDFLARIQIPIKSREIAAGNLQAKRVAAQEHIAGGPEIEFDFVRLTRIHERRMFPGTPVAHAENSFRDIHRETVRRNIDEFAREIRIHRR